MLTEYALKPLIGRRSSHTFAFPSGHTTCAVAVATTIALFLLPAGAFAGLPRGTRTLLATLAAVLAGTVPLGLITLRYHYATDVLASAAVVVAMILTFALAVDTAARHRTTTTDPASPPPPPVAETTRHVSGQRPAR